jgi:TatD DNase family protein
MLIDTHVHLDDQRYAEDREALIERAAQAGVEVLVTIGTSLDDSRWAGPFAREHKNIYAVLGSHPERVSEWKPDQMGEYEAHAREPKVVAIGEIGMDYHSEGFDKGAQEACFRDMIALGRKLKLPLVIHQRDAAEDTLRILREEKGGDQGGVFHCYAGTWDTAKAAMDLGFEIAVGGILTFPNAKDLREVIAKVPMERLVLETDGPWLAPQDQRGKRNEPAFIKSVAAKLAEIKQLSLEAVAEKTTANARRLFRI